ncbi:MAG: hypothetical protein II594_09680, partial [Clostridium sp.]|nr:hypothetical protein [Clostridium sp.]
RDQHGAHFIGVELGKGDIDCKKTLDALKEYAPADFDRINFEIEWAIGDDPLEVAQKKEMEACVNSIKYLREVLGLGVCEPKKK